ncbi:hypothetical protein D3C71_257220 [compost metagenome]
MGDYAEDAMQMSRRSGRVGRVFLENMPGQEVCPKCGGLKLSGTRNHTVCDVSKERHILNGSQIKENEEMFINEYEVDEILDITRTHFPEIEPYAQFLYDWKETINNNSDGWAYWKAGRGAADKLATLLNGAKMSAYGRGEVPTVEQLKKSLTPIRAAATRHGLPAPELHEASSTPSMR